MKTIALLILLFIGCNEITGPSESVDSPTVEPIGDPPGFPDVTSDTTSVTS